MITADKVKNQIQSLIDTANEKTGKEDINLTSAVGSLVDGFGEDLIPYMTKINGIFQGAVFPENYEIVLNIKDGMAELSNIFASAVNLKKITIKGNIADKVTMSSMLYNSTDVEEINFSSVSLLAPSTLVHFCTNVNKLHTINGTFDLTNCTDLTSAFNGRSLKEIRIKKETVYTSLKINLLSLLSDVSIQSIIDGLADLTGGTAQVLTVHKDVRAKIESNPEQLATIIDKNWTLASS